MSSGTNLWPREVLGLSSCQPNNVTARLKAELKRSQREQDGEASRPGYVPDLESPRGQGPWECQMLTALCHFKDEFIQASVQCRC